MALLLCEEKKQPILLTYHKDEQGQQASSKLTSRLGGLLIAAVIIRLFSYNPFIDLPHHEEAKVQIGKLIPTDCWYDIPKPFQCSYLHAPLDYLNKSDPRTAKLAVAVYPAGGGNTSKSDILGTILMNPGGPGGTGVGFLTAKSARYYNLRTAEAVDKLFKGRYNLLSWDPRGVQLSTPRAKCLASEDQRSKCGGGLPHASSAAAACNLQDARETARVCKNNAALADELRFVSTPSTARDMRLLYKAMGDDILHYWGFSYGTVLGSVFAAMFPDEVERVALDGVVDVPNYMTGLWSDNLLSSQGAYEVGLLGECEIAGDKCPLNAIAKNRNVNLKQLMDDFYTQLRDLPMISPSTKTPFLTYSNFKGLIFEALYKTQNWPELLNATAKAINGNATEVIEKFIDGGHKEASPQGFISIAGGDSIAKDPRWTISEYNDFIKIQEKDSETFGEVIVDNHSMIQEWLIEGKERYFGNYTVHTRNPILFVTNDYDPITPIPDARKMATLFPKAALLRSKAYGHCSSAQSSKCALDVISAFFINGTLPERRMGKDGLVEAGVVCDVDNRPWDDVSLSSVEQLEARQRAEAISEAVQGSWQRRLYRV